MTLRSACALALALACALPAAAQPPPDAQARMQAQMQVSMANAQIMFRAMSDHLVQTTGNINWPDAAPGVPDPAAQARKSELIANSRMVDLTGIITLPSGQTASFQRAMAEPSTSASFDVSSTINLGFRARETDGGIDIVVGVLVDGEVHLSPPASVSPGQTADLALTHGGRISLSVSARDPTDKERTAANRMADAMAQAAARTRPPPQAAPDPGAITGRSIISNSVKRGD